MQTTTVFYHIFIKINFIAIQSTQLSIVSIFSMWNITSDVNINKVYSYLIATLKNGKAIPQKASENQYKKVIEIGLEQHYTNKKLDKNNTKNLIKLLNDGIYKYKNAENESSFVNKIGVSFYIENIKTYGKALLDDLTLNYVDDLLEFLNNAEKDVESYILHIEKKS